MPTAAVTRRVRNAERLSPAIDVRQRVARCGIRVSGKGERRSVEKQPTQVKDEGAPLAVRRLPGEHDFLSPESQSSVAADYCAEEGLGYEKEPSIRLADIDVRARKEVSWRNRPGLTQHLKDAEDGAFTDIVFYKLSRLARNVQDGLEIIKAFMLVAVTGQFVRDPIPPIDTAIGQLILMIYLWLA